MLVYMSLLFLFGYGGDDENRDDESITRRVMDGSYTGVLWGLQPPGPGGGGDEPSVVGPN